MEELRPLVPEGATLAQLALRWILMFDGVTAAIPGARTPEQARANARPRIWRRSPTRPWPASASSTSELARPLVHQRW